jgi:hypothetical protein
MQKREKVTGALQTRFNYMRMQNYCHMKTLISFTSCKTGSVTLKLSMASQSQLLVSIVGTHLFIFAFRITHTLIYKISPHSI